MKPTIKIMNDACLSLASYEGGKQRLRAADTVLVERGEAKLRASAAVMRMLVNLREMSYSRDLPPSAIQAAIDGFFEAAEIDEDREPMGQIIYKHKVVA